MKTLLVVVGALLAYGVAAAWPEIVRYRRIRAM
jgi:hypothetical protein